MIEGQEVTVYYNTNKKTIEGIGIVKKVHQLLFNNKIALVDIEFKTGLFKDKVGTRMIKNDTN